MVNAGGTDFNGATDWGEQMNPREVLDVEARGIDFVGQELLVEKLIGELLALARELFIAVVMRGGGFGMGADWMVTKCGVRSNRGEC